jgi:hypothetical protein
MSHLPPTHHETSKLDSPNETEIMVKLPKCLGFKFKPRQVNDSSLLNQGTGHLVSQPGSLLDRIPRGDYMCPFCEVVVLGGDGMGSSTQMLVVRHVWVPAATSHCARHLRLPLPRALAGEEVERADKWQNHVGPQLPRCGGVFSVDCFWVSFFLGW